jgi:hypothetical protein
VGRDQADESGVVVFFPDFGLAAYTPDGKDRWDLPLGPFKNFYGMASSPIMAGDLLVLVCAQQSGSFLLALDRKTGRQRWKTERGAAGIGWATPMVRRICRTFQPRSRHTVLLRRRALNDAAQKRARASSGRRIFNLSLSLQAHSRGGTWLAAGSLDVTGTVWRRYVHTGSTKSRGNAYEQSIGPNATQRSRLFCHLALGEISYARCAGTGRWHETEFRSHVEYRTTFDACAKILALGVGDLTQTISGN